MNRLHKLTKLPTPPKSMEIECIGEVTEEGTISIDPSLLSDYEVGSKVRITIILPEDKDGAKTI